MCYRKKIMLFLLLVFTLVGIARGQNNPNRENLIKNPSFENLNPDKPDSPLDWLRNANELSLTLQKPGYSGNAAAYIGIDKLSVRGGGWLQKLSLEKDTTYTVSAWIKTKNIEKGMSLYVSMISEAKNLSKRGQIIQGTTDWIFYQMTFKTPTETLSDCCLYPVFLDTTSRKEGEIWIDDVVIVKGGASVSDAEQTKNLELLRNIATKIKTLESNIDNAVSAGRVVYFPKLTLTVLKLFEGFVQTDMQDPEFSSLAVFEICEMDKVADRAIKEVEDIIANPEKDFTVRHSSRLSAPVEVRNGRLYCGDVPVFLSGIYRYPGFWFRSPEVNERLSRIAESLKLNLYQLGFTDPGSTMTGWNKFNNDADKRISQAVNAAERDGFVLAPYISVRQIPKWASKEDSSVVKHMGHDMEIDCYENPVGLRYVNSWWTYVGSKLKTQPRMFCYLPYGEESLTETSDYTVTRFADWLEKKYVSVAMLNEIWQTSFPTFQDAAKNNTPVRDNKKRAAFYDWHVFNQHRLSSYYQNQQDLIKKEDPKALFTRFTSNEGLMSNHGQVLGIDRETAVSSVKISGCDSRPLYADNHWKLCEEHYILDWITQSFGFDFMKSVAPDNPIYDAEWHSIEDGGFEYKGIPPEYMRTVLWLAHCHGMCAHNIWGWMRRSKEISQKDEIDKAECAMLYNLVTQPQVLDSWLRTMEELRDIADIITLFPNQDRRVRIFYSEASAIHAKSYLNDISKVYESIYFLDYPAGFITERQINNGELKNCSLLIIPNAKYVSMEVTDKIKDYKDKGGKVVFLGAEALQFDEYGRKRDTSTLKKNAVVLNLNDGVKALSGQFDSLFDEVGVTRPVKLTGTDGKRLWGVELRSIVRNGKKLAYMVNLTKHNVKISLKPGKKGMVIRELTRHEDLKQSDIIILEPMKPILLEEK